MDSFIKQQKVILPKKTDGENNKAYVFTINRNFNDYGYSLSKEAIEQLSECSVNDIVSFYQKTMADIKEFLGTDLFEKTQTFYPNFPEQVMETDELELYVNQFLYYIADFDFEKGHFADGEGLWMRDVLVGDKEMERPPKPDYLKDKPKILVPTTVQEMGKEYHDKIHGIGISASELEDLGNFIKKYPGETDNIIDAEGAFRSNENKVKLALMLYEQYKQNKDQDTLEKMYSLMPNTNDVLRFYAVLGAKKKGIEDITNYVNLSFDNKNKKNAPQYRMGYGYRIHVKEAEDKTKRHNINFCYAVSSQDKRVIRGALSRAKDLYTGVWDHEQIWQKAFTKYLGIDEKANKKLQTVKQNLWSKTRVDERGKEIPKPNALIDKAVSEFIYIYHTDNSEQLEMLFKSLNAFTETMKTMASFDGMLNTSEQEASDYAQSAIDKANEFYEAAKAGKSRGDLQQILSEMTEKPVGFQSYADNAEEKPINKNKVNSLEKTAKRFPGIFVRRFNEIFHKLLTPELSDAQKLEAAKKLGEIYSSLRVSPATTMSIKKLMNEELEWESKIIKNNTGKIVLTENANSKEKISEKVDMDVYTAMLDEINKAFDNSIVENTKDTKEWGRVYIDPELEYRKASQRNERSASENASVSRGSILPGEKDRNLLFFGESWKGVDNIIDISAGAYDKDGNKLGMISWQNLKESWGMHSGDYVSAPEGCHEFIVFDKQKLKDAGIAFLTAEIHGWNDELAVTEDKIHFITMEKAGSFDYTDKDSDNFITREYESDATPGKVKGVMFLGKVVEPSEFKNSIVVTGKTRESIPVLYDVEKDQCIWVDEKCNVKGLATSNSKESISIAQSLIKRAQQDITPSIKELVEAYAANNYSTIVNNPEEADTVFLAEQQDIEFAPDVSVHTALDSGYIASYLVSLQEEFEQSKRFEPQYIEEEIEEALEEVLKEDFDDIDEH